MSPTTLFGLSALIGIAIMALGLLWKIVFTVLEVGVGVASEDTAEYLEEELKVLEEEEKDLNEQLQAIIDDPDTDPEVRKEAAALLAS